MRRCFGFHAAMIAACLVVVAPAAWGQEAGPLTLPASATTAVASVPAATAATAVDFVAAASEFGDAKEMLGGSGCCDCAKAGSASHKVVFYDNNFDYLCDSCGCAYLGDRLKRLPIGNCWTVDVGGQYRMRYQSEQNISPLATVPNGLGLTGDDDDFLLHRTRLYVNAEYGQHLRFYGEMLDAAHELGNGAPRSIEENRTELQNLFLELRGMNVGRGTLGARVGRQEIMLGAQRLVSPLDWANTRRTFDGARLMYQGDSWDVDGFWLRPMNYDANAFDSPNLNRQFYGAYGTYKGFCHDKLEAYWLAIDYEDVGASGIRYDTLGSRYYGTRGNWLFEFEGGVQFGENSDGSDHSAGFATGGVGREFPCALFSPTLWGYYDWASGDNTVGNGFHHMEPLAHQYLGFMDLFGRRNIQDLNLQATAQLTQKTKLLVWYHYFMLANQNDVPYNVDMSNFAGLTGPSGSKELGHEVDILLTYNIAPRSSILLGYSHFFAGDFYGTTAGTPFDGDADFAYVQWHLNF